MAALGMSRTQVNALRVLGKKPEVSNFDFRKSLRKLGEEPEFAMLSDSDCLSTRLAYRVGRENLRSTVCASGTRNSKVIAK